MSTGITQSATEANIDKQSELMALLDSIIKDGGAVAATAIITFPDGRQWKISGSKVVSHD